MRKTLPRIIPTILIILCSRYSVFMYLTLKAKAIRKKNIDRSFRGNMVCNVKICGELVGTQKFPCTLFATHSTIWLNFYYHACFSTKKSWQMDVWPQLWAMAFLMKSLEKLQKKSLWPLLLSKVSTNLKSSGMAIYRQRKKPLIFSQMTPYLGFSGWQVLIGCNLLFPRL